MRERKWTSMNSPLTFSVYKDGPSEVFINSSDEGVLSLQFASYQTSRVSPLGDSGLYQLYFSQLDPAFMFPHPDDSLK